jgi:FAD/FMN-containing dehydrogenase
MKTHRLAPSAIATEPAWLNEAPLFSSPGFVNLWSTMGGSPVSLVVEDDERVVACLSGVEFGMKMVRRFQATPNGCYAQLLVDPAYAERRDDYGKAILDLIVDIGYAKAYVTDYYGHFPTDERFHREPTSTLLVDVRDPDWEPPDKKARQQIRKGVREGRQVLRFDWERHHADFMYLMHTSANRLGREPSYPPAFFKALAKLAETDDRIRWVLLEHDGKPVASSIFLAEGDQLLHWQVYFDEDRGHLQPNKLIPFLMAREWASQGGHYLNLGATPVDVPGVAEYTAKWGGEPFVYQTLVRRSGVGRLV